MEPNKELEKAIEVAGVGTMALGGLLLRGLNGEGLYSSSSTSMRQLTTSENGQKHLHNQYHNLIQNQGQKLSIST